MDATSFLMRVLIVLKTVEGKDLLKASKQARLVDAADFLAFGATPGRNASGWCEVESRSLMDSGAGHQAALVTRNNGREARA